MLIGIDPLLGGELLAALDVLGHGDLIAVVDGNFPAMRLGRKVVHCAGHDAVEILSATLSVIEPDHRFPATLMNAGLGDPTDVQQALIEAIRAARRGGHASQPQPFATNFIERQAFYDQVSSAELVIATSETRLFGNVIFGKEAVTWPHTTMSHTRKGSA